MLLVSDFHYSISLRDDAKDELEDEELIIDSSYDSSSLMSFKSRSYIIYGTLCTSGALVLFDLPDSIDLIDLF